MGLITGGDSGRRYTNKFQTENEIMERKYLHLQIVQNFINGVGFL